MEAETTPYPLLDGSSERSLLRRGLDRVPICPNAEGRPAKREAALGKDPAHGYRPTFTAFFTTKLSLRYRVTW